MKVLEKFIKTIVIALIFMLSLLILFATVNLGWEIIKKLLEPPIALIDMYSLLDLFGFFMLILIGIELIETIKVYITKHTLRVEIVLLVAIMVASRKIIIIDINQVTDMLLISMGILIICLTGGYYLIKKIHRDTDKKRI